MQDINIDDLEELSWNQLCDKLDWLAGNGYNDYSLAMTLSDSYASQRVQKVLAFEGINDEEYMAFTPAFYRQKCPKSLKDMCKSIRDIIPSIKMDKIVVLVETGGRSSSVFGLHIDNESKHITMLNAWYHGEIVDWSDLDILEV